MVKKIILRFYLFLASKKFEKIVKKTKELIKEKEEVANILKEKESKNNDLETIIFDPKFNSKQKEALIIELEASKECLKSLENYKDNLSKMISDSNLIYLNLSKINNEMEDNFFILNYKRKYISILKNEKKFLELEVKIKKILKEEF